MKQTHACTQLLFFAIWVGSPSSSFCKTSYSHHVPPPNQPTGPQNIPELQICRKHNGQRIDCPPHTTQDNELMAKFMDECLQLDKFKGTGAICVFFPRAKDGTSCHQQKGTTTYPCAYGYKIIPSRELRREAKNENFISVEFFGKIPPFPVNETKQHDDYESAMWLAISFSKDELMGDDVILYCHPYMDRTRHPWGKGQDPDANLEELDHEYQAVRYPDDIGVSISSSRQIYDVDQTRFGRDHGTVIGMRVKLLGDAWDPTTTTQKDGWWVLHCGAEVSTYLMLTPKKGYSVGVEFDMQSIREGHVIMGIGNCLQHECLGDYWQNTGDFASIARASTPIAKHHKLYFTEGKTTTLFYKIGETSQQDAVLATRQSILWPFVLLLFQHIVV